MYSIFKTSLRRLILLLGIGLAMATLLGFMARAAWWLDLFSHFRVQYALALLVCAVLAICLRARLSAAIWMLLFLVNLATFLPYLGGGRDVPDSGSDPVRCMLFNVNTHYGDPASVARAIAAENPDLLLLQEVNAMWLQTLAPVVSGLGYRMEVPREDNFGIALYSRLPLHKVEVVPAPGTGTPSILAEVEVRGQRVHVLAIHPVPPKSSSMGAARNALLKELAACVDAQSPTMMMGDLNLTPWSPHFKDLLRDSGLRDSMRGFGVQASWPTFSPLWRIPIDHLLVSDHVKVTDRRIGAHAGSDHFPVLFSFSLE